MVLARVTTCGTVLSAVCSSAVSIFHWYGQYCSTAYHTQYHKCPPLNDSDPIHFFHIQKYSGLLGKTLAKDIVQNTKVYLTILLGNVIVLAQNILFCLEIK